MAYLIQAKVFMPVSPLHKLIDQLEHIILGKQTQIELAITCLLARGHLLIEDLPGVGKTTLAHALARGCGLEFQRIQFTSDLLPADVTGVSIYDRDQGAFRFHPGPIFSQVLLADEINRATPKAQSALLEAMEERQISIDGQSHVLPAPFFVIATQNPNEQVGTYPLPESQLDRFLMRIDIGYPDPQAERELLSGRDRQELIKAIDACMDVPTFLALQEMASNIHAAPPILDYVQALLLATRTSPHIKYGLSPRAGLGLMAAARAMALLRAREYLVPEDIQAVFPAVAGHRLILVETETSPTANEVHGILDRVPIP